MRVCIAELGCPYNATWGLCSALCAFQTNMNNVLEDNVAVASLRGFDINPKGGVRKDPKLPYPETSRAAYKYYAKGHTFGRFEGNKAHSCNKEGFRQWERFAAKVNCYCTPLPGQWTAAAFYGRDNIQRCSYTDCGVNVEVASPQDLAASGARKGYALYEDLTLYANGWPTFAGLAYRAHGLMFPGLVGRIPMSPSCVCVWLPFLSMRCTARRFSIGSGGSVQSPATH
eukprot:scaffold7601_cov417-Prasinococcus_capsulatus_cf.AAC.8